MASAKESNNILGRELGRVEHQYLRTERTANEVKKPELVQNIMENFVLKELQGTFSGVAYVGSSYEFTSIPSQSDYDIQLYLKLPSTPVVEVSDEDPAWATVYGGPKDLLDSQGYLSTLKARRLVQSKIDRALEQRQQLLFNGDEVFISRSMHGPAATLKVQWRDVWLSIDIVVSLRANDVRRSWYRSFYNDLVGKSYDSFDKRDESKWRIAYSLQELEELRSFHYNAERKLTLLRIMKVIKQHQTQLRKFPSYFYKNILFKLNKEESGVSWSYPSDLSERFKDMIRVMRDCLQAGVLPVHFNKEVNYLQNMSTRHMNETANYLQRIITNDDYIKLVQAVPSTHKPVPESELEKYEEPSWSCLIM